jgi:hypothetical protein
MPTERETVVVKTGVSYKLSTPLIWAGVALAVALVFTLFLAIPSANKHSALREKIHNEFCASRGWDAVTNYGHKCVAKDGTERLIPDAVWKPLRDL